MWFWIGEICRSLTNLVTWAANLLAHCGIRIALWIVTVFGSLFPPFYAADAKVSFNLSSMFQKVNNSGLFRDLFYVVVVIALLGICNIAYSLITEQKPHVWVGLIFVIAIAYFLYIIVYGTGAFTHMADISAQNHILNAADFDYNFNVIIYTMIAGLATELVLAIREA